jgi:tetratricopeptide (TPR) repeat protein
MRHIAGITLLSLFAGLLLATGCRPSQPAPASDDSIAEGWRHYRLGEFDQAVRLFQRAQQEPATRLPGLFGEAQTWHWRWPKFDRNRAGQLYRQVLADAPDSDLAAWSLLALAQIKIVATGSKPANAAAVEPDLQQVWIRYPDHPAATEAFLEWRALRLQENTPAAWRTVVTALNQFLEQHPATPYASTFHFMRAHCYRLLNEPRNEFAAVLRARETQETDPTNPSYNPVTIYWRLATLAEFDLGDFATARQYYRRLIAEYPQDQSIFMARQELQRMDDVEARLRQELRAAKGGDS